MLKKINSLTFFAILSLWVIYVIAHIIDFIYVYSVLIFMYEVFVGGSLIIFHYLFGFLRASLPYIFIYLGLCVFNVIYKGYYEFKFFGIDLKQYKKKTPYWIFLFKEYNYFILLLFHLFIFLIIFYYELYYKVVIISVFFIFYLFIVLHILIKYFFKKYKYEDKKSINLCINILLAFVLSIYISTVGEAINQIIEIKIDMVNYWYKLIQGKDFFLKKYQIDHERHWTRFYYTFKNEAASAYYLFLKKSSLNNKILNNLSVIKGRVIENSNLDKILKNQNVSNLLIEKQDLKDVNMLNNNIYIEQSKVWYEVVNKTVNENIFANINKANNNKMWRAHLLNVYSSSATHYSNPAKSLKSITSLLTSDNKYSSYNYNIEDLLINDDNKPRAIAALPFDFNDFYEYAKGRKNINSIYRSSYMYQKLRNTLYYKQYYLNYNILKSFNQNWYKLFNLHYNNKCNNNIKNIKIHYSNSFLISKYILFRFDIEDNVTLKYNNIYIFKQNVNLLKYKISSLKFVLKSKMDLYLDQWNLFKVKNIIIVNYQGFIVWWEKNFYIVNNNIQKLKMYNFNKQYENETEQNSINEQHFKLNLIRLLDRNTLYLNWYKKCFKYSNVIGWEKKHYSSILTIRNNWCTVYNKKFNQTLFNSPEWEFSLSNLKYLSDLIRPDFLYTEIIKYRKPYFPVVQYKLEDPFLHFFLINKKKIIVCYANSLHPLSRELFLRSYGYTKIFQGAIKNYFKINKLEDVYVYNKTYTKIIQFFNNLYKHVNNIKDLNKKADTYIKKYKDKTLNEDFIVIEDVNKLKKLTNYIEELGRHMYKENIHFKNYILTEGMAELIATNVIFCKFELFELMDFLKDLNQELLVREFSHIEPSKYSIACFKNNSFKMLKNPYLDRNIYLKAYKQAYKKAYENYYDEEFYEYNANSEYKCKSERIVAEKLAMVQNRKNVAEMAFDTRNLIYLEAEYDTTDLDLLRKLLKNKLRHDLKEEARYFLKSYLNDEFNELNDEVKRLEGLISKKLLVNRRQLDIFRNKATEKLTRYISLKKKCEADQFFTKLQLNKGSAKDKADIKYVLNKKFKPSAIASSIIKQYNICLILIKLDFYKALNKLTLVNSEKCSSLIKESNAIKELDEEEINYKVKTNKGLVDLKLLAKKQKEWKIYLKNLEEEERLQKAYAPVNALHNYLIKSDWDAYNRECLKMEKQNFNLMRQFNNMNNKK